jgi:thiol-disulfide isomerase/thioredoxin
MITKLLTLLMLALPLGLRGQGDSAYVGRVCEKLARIGSASYFWDQSASAIYDTVPLVSYRVFKKEFANPADTLVGAFIASFRAEDTTRLVYFYDGKVQSYPDWEHKTIPADSFQHDRYPFRIVYPPFFTQVKCLLKYAQETADSTSILVTGFKDSVRIRLTFHGKLVEVVGNRIVYANPATVEDERWSVYEIWIRSADDLPYRFVKKFPDRVCWESCRQIRTDTARTVTFVASDYFPAGFVVTKYENGAPAGKNLEGTVAPAWKLKAADGHETTLRDLKSKVLLVQFTGIGCGPCYHSIPCLAGLRDQFPRAEFEIVSIETWSGQPAVIKKHITANRIGWPYLAGDPEVKEKYAIRSVPKFFILDERRVIRKIISGFDRERTCAEIREAVDNILKTRPVEAGKP